MTGGNRRSGTTLLPLLPGGRAWRRAPDHPSFQRYFPVLTASPVSSGHAPASERPPGGESFEDVIARVAAAMERITAEHAGRDIVAVVHGGTIRAALSVALGIDPERALGFAVDTCSVTRMDYLEGATEGAAWRIVAVNQHPQALTR